jgi:hypothetical protein
MYPIGYALFSLGDLLSPLYDLLITVVGVVIAELALYKYMRAMERPKIVIGTARQGNNLGFSVTVRRKMIKDARVRCNNMNYVWEDEGKPERKDLFVGDTPSLFFPFQMSMKYVDDISNYPYWSSNGQKLVGNGILTTVTETKTQETVYEMCTAIPEGVVTMIVLGQYMNEPSFNATVRIIGEGIEEVKEYFLHLGLNSLVIPAIREGKPIMDFVQCSFELKKKGSRFRL